jgi:hypothetical protein
MTPLAPSAPVVAERPRTLLGRVPNLGDREYVYRCDDALEIDAIDGYEVETKRVFFSDVEMITWHSRFSVGGLWIGGVSVACGLLLWLVVLAGTHDSTAGWITFWVFFVPNLPVLGWFLWPYWHVTVYGRRSVARMRWHFRRERSHRIFQELVREVRAWQEAHREPVTATATPADFVAPLAPASSAPN